jgi:hypothetical protein
MTSYLHRKSVKIRYKKHINHFNTILLQTVLQYKISKITFLEGYRLTCVHNKMVLKCRFIKLSSSCADIKETVTQDFKVLYCMAG